VECSLHILQTQVMYRSYNFTFLFIIEECYVMFYEREKKKKTLSAFMECQKADNKANTCFLTLGFEIVNSLGSSAEKRTQKNNNATSSAIERKVNK
jgi:hypothetical protein